METAPQQAPYSRRDFARAVNLSAVFGWAGVTFVALSDYLEHAQHFGDVLWMLPWYALVGLPIALLTCWLLLAPILWLLMRKGMSYYRAAYCGAGVGSTFAILGIAFSRYWDWRSSSDQARNYRIGGDGVDVALRPDELGIMVLISAGFILICVLSALLVRVILGPGHTDQTFEIQQ
ncbi:hypothetical protein [Ruegeria sp.]|uniref:hypothetical protein n=1 Tax=Ruegeria sp. TaxID=1879320 RepID=UPI00231496D7|nr:hypothetical protein [Ruegeria sp.]MDA7964725.1 hypothetical protein [Ruegeria sp.]